MTLIPIRVSRRTERLKTLRVNHPGCRYRLSVMSHPLLWFESGALGSRLTLLRTGVRCQERRSWFLLPLWEECIVLTVTITSAPQGARARVRAELTREIKSV